MDIGGTRIPSFFRGDIIRVRSIVQMSDSSIVESISHNDRLM